MIISYKLLVSFFGGAFAAGAFGACESILLFIYL